jgi:hypothetical protein
MNLIHIARAALAAAVLAGGVLGASVAPTLADTANMQPTQVLFTSGSAAQDPAKAFDTPGMPLSFSGVVAPNASGTVVMFDAGPNGNNAAIASAPVTDGQFSITIPAFSQMSLGNGTHLLTAVYLGNDGMAPSSSPVFTEVIQGQHF